MAGAGVAFRMELETGPGGARVKITRPPPPGGPEKRLRELGSLQARGAGKGSSWRSWRERRNSRGAREQGAVRREPLTLQPGEAASLCQPPPWQVGPVWPERARDS